ncbi:PREDICTED: helicase with zinc finger domain 2 [Condylura cristata]|uniref:helicase with zinc finger domain 2 n=1 Tax=Condylura cristata TaxID=143302 RepID=UPI000642B316|nr:PREDICTED: helicase with zinc finger domain 2 [Condylura cristata]
MARWSLWQVDVQGSVGIARSHWACEHPSHFPSVLRSPVTAEEFKPRGSGSGRGPLGPQAGRLSAPRAGHASPNSAECRGDTDVGTMTQGDRHHEQPEEDSALGARAAHLMVKEYMILFNSLVAEFLVGSELTRTVTPLRWQPPPGGRQLEALGEKHGELVPLSLHLGQHLRAGTPCAQLHVLAGLWARVQQAAHTEDLSLLVDLLTTDDLHPALALAGLDLRRALGRSALGRSSQGDRQQASHYSLQVDWYTWASSPIRRYLDVAVQRLLLLALGHGGCAYSAGDIDRLCQDFGRQHVVLLGDHKQLRPVVKNEQLQNLGLDRSLFERYQKDAYMLDTQYRMHEGICAFPSAEFYRRQLKTWKGLRRPPSVLGHAQRDSCPVLFGHVQGHEQSLLVSTDEGNENSKANLEEVAQVVRIAKQLTLGKTVDPRDIAILTPYNAQAAEINRGLLREGVTGVTVCSITKSQGSEWRYVLVSTVRSCPEGDVDQRPTKGWLKKFLGFVVDPNQVNVAITRAQEGLCLIGGAGRKSGPRSPAAGLDSILPTQRPGATGGVGTRPPPLATMALRRARAGVRLTLGGEAVGPVASQLP